MNGVEEPFEINKSEQMRGEKEKMKRKFVYAIFLVMVTLFFVGCGKTETMKETESETVSEDFAGLSVEGKETEQEEPEPSAEELLLAQEEENKQIYEAYMMSEFEYKYYAYVDLDGDGLSELLLARELADDGGTGYPEGVSRAFYADIFMIADGEVLELGDYYGSSFGGLMYSEANHSIGYTWGGGGCNRYIMLSLSGQEIRQNILSDYFSASCETLFYYDENGASENDGTDEPDGLDLGLKITEEEYEAYLGEWENADFQYIDFQLISRSDSQETAPVDAASWEIIQEYGFVEDVWDYGPGEEYSLLSFELDLDTIRDYGSWYTVEALFGKPIYVSEEEYQSGHFTITTNELTGETETVDLEFDNDGFCYEYWLEDGMLYWGSGDRYDCTFYRGILCVNKDAEVGVPITNQYWSAESGDWPQWVNGVFFDENGCVTSMLSFGD